MQKILKKNVKHSITHEAEQSGEGRATLLRRWSVNLQQCAGQLDDATAIKEAMLCGCRNAGANLRQQATEQFLPHGVTVAMILAESHYVVSTWPEHGFVTLDVAVCNPQLDIQLLVVPVIDLLQPRRSDGSLQETDLQTGQSRDSNCPVALVAVPAGIGMV